MSPHRAAPSFPHRVLAAVCAALVLGLTVFAASPEAHRWVHADPGSHSCGQHGDAPVPASADHICAITLFGHGVQLDAAPAALLPPREIAAALPRIAAGMLDLVAPRYLRQPERGPPASRV